jgi:hypothetical protein
MRKTYPTDLSDQEWACLKTHLPAFKPLGRLRTYTLRDIVSSNLLIGGCPMTQTSELAKEALKDLITIERTLWENNAEIYHDRYSPEAVLIFPGVGPASTVTQL